MKFRVLVMLFAILVASAASADLKPKCDPKKAARNAAMDATVGVGGRCDADKVAKNAKEDVKDSVDLDRDKNHKNHKKNREHNKNKD